MLFSLVDGFDVVSGVFAVVAIVADLLALVSVVLVDDVSISCVVFVDVDGAAVDVVFAVVSEVTAVVVGSGVIVELVGVVCEIFVTDNAVVVVSFNASVVFAVPLAIPPMTNHYTIIHMSSNF